MIDDRKIEEAKEVIFVDNFPGRNGKAEIFIDEDAVEIFDKEDIKDAIGLGAEWAINEFLKDLWHPISEEPREKATLLIEISITKPTPRKFYYTDILIGQDWEIKCSVMHISRWLYIDDLLPKKEGNIDLK